MTVWIVGNNLPGYLPDSDPYVSTSREDALQYLKSEAEAFVEDQESRAYILCEEYSGAALLESIFAEADGSVPADGPMSFMMTDLDGWGRVFFMAETKEQYYEFPEHGGLHTLGDALIIWGASCSTELAQKFGAAALEILLRTPNVTDEEGLSIITEVLASHDIHPLHDLGLGLPVKVN